MRVSLYPATYLASLIVVLSAAGFIAAQGPVGRPSTGGAAPAKSAPNGTNVACVDISHIFKNHNVFNTRLVELNERGAELDAWVRTQQRDLSKMREELQAFKAGTPEYKQLEEKITKAIAENDLSLRRQRTDFLNDEAQLYYETYNQIEQAVAKFALRANIGIVIRFTREPLKNDDPRALQAGIVSRMVIFQHRLDITELILKDLNAGTQPPPQVNKANNGIDAQGQGTKLAQPPRGTKTR